jgi:Leucine-rich repeat (LRR) protein
MTTSSSMNKIQIKKCYPYNLYKYNAIFSTLDLHGQKPKIVEIPSLKDFIFVKKLDLSFNDITNISPLKSLVSLKEIDLSFNGIKNVSSLKFLVDLEILILEDNNVGNVTPLKRLINLKFLDLQDNPIAREQIYSLKKELPNCCIQY